MWEGIEKRRACIRVNHTIALVVICGGVGAGDLIFAKTAGAADPPPVRGILVVALRVVVVVVGSIDARHPSSHLLGYSENPAFPDATALCRGVAAGERENPFVSWVSAAVNVNTTKAHEST